MRRNLQRTFQSSVIRIFRARALAHFNRCQWCNTSLTLATATVDHIRPVCAGGTDADSNLCLACQKCNNQKDNQNKGLPRYGPTDWSVVLGESRPGEGNLYTDLKAIWDQPPPPSQVSHPNDMHLLLRDGRPLFRGTLLACESQERSLRRFLEESGQESVLEIRRATPNPSGPDEPVRVS